MIEISWRSKLFHIKSTYDTESTNTLFYHAVKENYDYHYHHCREYKKISDAFQISPDRVQGYLDIEKIPVLPTLLFKNHHMFSMPQRRMLIRATSSGTKGKFSEIGIEFGGLLCGLRMVLNVCRSRKLISPMPCHYIIFGYQLHKGNRTAAAKSAYGATWFTPALSKTYALRYVKSNQKTTADKSIGESYSADLEQVVEAIVEHSHSHFPLRLVGFPAYAFFVLKQMEDRGIHVKLRQGSKILLGGGWKQFYTEQVDKQTFYELAYKVLGIGDEDIVEFYSAVEHPVLYCDCKLHHFHVPVYSRVIIRDVNTLKPCGYGEVGLVNLISPMVKATPIVSIMTDDLGILHKGSECGCGITSPYVEIVGRVGLHDIKTCAAGASELLAEEIYDIS